MEWNKIKLDILLELELTQLSVSGPTATTRCSGRGTTTGSRTSSTSWQPTACSTPRWGVRHVRLLVVHSASNIVASSEIDLLCAAGWLLPGHVPDRGPAADVPQLRGGRLLGAESADVPPKVQHARLLHSRFPQACSLSRPFRQGQFNTEILSSVIVSFRFFTRSWEDYRSIY